MAETINQVKPNSRNRLVYMDVSTSITNMCLGAAAWAAIYKAQTLEFAGPLRSHMVLTTFGYILMMTQSVLSITKTSGWTRALKPSTREKVQVVVGIMGAAMAIAGTSIANINFTVPRTTHAIIGYTALALTILTTLISIAHFFLSGRLPTGPIYDCSAFLNLIMAFIAFTIGLHKFYEFPTATTFSVFAVLGLTSTILNVLIGKYKMI